jgi:hypothetical protein
MSDINIEKYIDERFDAMREYMDVRFQSAADLATVNRALLLATVSAILALGSIILSVVYFVAR